MNKKGMSGITTLIIFISMIIVAVVTSSALLSVSSALQSQALSTGKESRQQVSTKMQVESVTGEIDAPFDSVDYLRLIVKLSPGSGNLDFPQAIMSVRTETNLYSAIDYNASTGDTEALLKEALGNQEVFSVRWLNGSPAVGRSTISSDELVEIWFFINGELLENEKINITLTPIYGSATSVSFTTPPAFSRKYEKFYP